MRRIALWLSLLLLPVAAAHAVAEPAFADDPRGLYSRKTPSRDGIGKVYMGREISFVLDHRGVQWLERDERAHSERPGLLVANLDVAPDAVVADVGAGSGYMTFRISSLLPRGKVLAVDIQPEMLERIARRREELEVSNVECVLGTLTDTRLPAGSVDLALLVDAYHEFSHPREMMESIVRSLVPGGRVVLVEYREEDPDVPILPLHKMSERQARLELEAAGLVFVENRSFLPLQHVLVFRKPGPG